MTTSQGNSIPPEPPWSRTKRGTVNGRWRWWYGSICDYRLDHPGCSNADVAAMMGKHENTISMIV